MNESFSAEWKEGRSRNIITAYQERGGEVNLEVEKYVGELRILREEFSALATAYDGQQEKNRQMSLNIARLQTKLEAAKSVLAD